MRHYGERGLRQRRGKATFHVRSRGKGRGKGRGRRSSRRSRFATQRNSNGTRSQGWHQQSPIHTAPIDKSG